MVGSPILVLDTSGINRLADDPDSVALMAGLTAGFHVRLTFTSVSEIVATTNGGRRKALLDLCRKLQRSGDCLEPQHEIIRKMVAAFEASSEFDWRTVDVRSVEAERAIARHENFDDELAQREREEARARDKRFAKVYEDAKAPFDRLFISSPDQIPRKLSEMIVRLQVEGGAYWVQAASVCSRVAKRSFDEAAVRKFVTRCPPFRALMLAFFAAQYDRCVRPHNPGLSLRSGRNDTFMSVSLPYCHDFVTDDVGRLACYQEVVPLAELDVHVSSYDDFRSRFQVLETVRTGVDPAVAAS